MPDTFDFEAENYDGKRVLLSWGDVSDMVIERSEQRGGPYTQVAKVSLSSQYIDTLPSTRNSRDEYYYRLRPADITVTGPNGNPVVDENGDLMQSDVDTEGLDILGPERAEPEVGSRTAYVRQQAYRHLRRVGETAYVFEEQTGTRCPDCWDSVRKVRERSDCGTCGGSGYVNGWSTPLEVLMSFGTGEAEPKQTQGGKMSTLQLQCWTAAIPEVDVGDHVVRDRDREVFRVVKRQPTKKGPHDIRQNVIIKLVERGSEKRSVAEKLSP